MSTARTQDTASIEPEMTAEERQAIDDAILLIYQNLRQRARMLVRRQRNCSLQGTELVHEVLPALRKIRQATNGDLLLATAMKIMSHKLVDHARRKAAGRRGNGVRHTILERAGGIAALPLDYQRLYDALEQLP